MKQKRTDPKLAFRPDTLTNAPVVPYLIMIVCGLMDGVIFLKLFQRISCDSPFQPAIQAAGLLMAFDIVPFFLGIQLRRLKEGIHHEKVSPWLALSVCALAFVMNVVLCVMTLSLPATTDAYNAGDAMAPAALAVFGIVLPLLTGIVLFLLSYCTYNPPPGRPRRMEESDCER